MAEKSFTLNFDGYWHEARVSDMPEYSGIYCVYKCRCKPEANTVAMRRLLYMGDASNIRMWLQDHSMWLIWQQFLKVDEQICISTAEVDPVFRKRVVAACIRRHEPPANSEYRDEFPFDKTRVITKGKNAFLDSAFAIEATQKVLH